MSNHLLAADFDDATTARYGRQMSAAQPEDSTSARELPAGAVPMGQLVKA